MAYAFDTLGYAKRLRSAGVQNEQAEAHAEAAREFIMVELVTKLDLQSVRSDLQSVRSDLLLVKSELQANMDALGLRLTVRFGSMLVAAVGVLAVLIRLN